jgi:hypothetical protein
MGQKKTTIQTGTWSPTWGYSLQASASMAQYPTTDNKRNGTNYWITGSMIIASASVTFTTSSLGLGPANTSAKVSIPVGNFVGKNTRIPNEANDVKAFSILSYNGIISTIGGYNDISSSTFNGVSQSYVVMHVSASKANMGSVVGNDLYISLGTTQNSSVTRNGNDSTTNVSESMAFATKYPTNTNRTNKGTTYGYPSNGDTTRFVRTKTNVTDIAAYVLKYPNNTTKAGWVDGKSPKNQ